MENVMAVVFASNCPKGFILDLIQISRRYQASSSQMLCLQQMQDELENYHIAVASRQCAADVIPVEMTPSHKDMIDASSNWAEDYMRCALAAFIQSVREANIL